MFVNSEMENHTFQHRCLFKTVPKDINNLMFLLKRFRTIDTNTISDYVNNNKNEVNILSEKRNTYMLYYIIKKNLDQIPSTYLSY